MRYTVLGFNQEMVMQTNLDLTDLLILQYVIEANGSPTMKHIVEDGVSYVWLSHEKILEDLPILDMIAGTLRNRIATLKKEGFLMSVTKRNPITGSMTYYCVSELTMSFINDVRCHSKITSNNKLKDNNKDISKDISSETETSSNPDTEESSERQPKKQNLYEKCVSAIDKYPEIADNEELSQALLEYIPIRLAMKDKPLRGVNQWVGMLNQLMKMKNKTEVVQQSIAHGWAMFYELKPNGGGFTGNSKKDVFGELGQVTSIKQEGGDFIGDF